MSRRSSAGRCGDCADPRAAPAVAINRFLRENRGRWRLLSVTAQVVLQKPA